MQPVFFASAKELRVWLEANHRLATELWVGFWKAHTEKKGLTYSEALDEALCFGWIDGLKKRLDEQTFTQRFTPRRANSIWSGVNTRRANALRRAGRMAGAGLEALARRDPRRSGLYSFENRDCTFDPATERRFRANRKAWSFFQAQPPGYRRTATFWVMSARREETRARRLARLLQDSALGERLAAIAGEPKKRAAD